MVCMKISALRPIILTEQEQKVLFYTCVWADLDPHQARTRRMAPSTINGGLAFYLGNWR